MDFSLSTALTRRLGRQPAWQIVKRRFPPLIQGQARRKPHCRIAGPLALGFSSKIAAAPFAS